MFFMSRTRRHALIYYPLHGTAPSAYTVLCNVMPRWGIDDARYCMRYGVQDARAFNNPAQAKHSVGYGDDPSHLRASGTRP